MRLTFVSLVLFFAACSSSEPLSPADRERLAPHLGAKAPATAARSGARFGDAVVLEAWELSADEVAPGDAVSLSLYFRVERELEEGTRAFTHLVDARGNLLSNADDAGLVRVLHPADRWKPGDRIRDEVLLRVPKGAHGPTRIRVGFFRGDERVEVKLADGGRADHVALDGPLGKPARAKREPLPELVVRRAEGIVIDGKLDEASWAAAEITSGFVHTLTGAPARVTARARAAWDDRYLYFAVEVTDGDLRTPFEERDDPLWEADVVELFLDPSNVGVDYLELQVSPRGITFDTHYARRRVPGPIGNAGWDSKMEAAVELKGTLNDRSPDTGYTVEARVPFSALAARSGWASAPAAGARWRANFYVIDRGRRHSSAAAWSPPLVPDFHFPPRFGRLVFAE